MKPLRYLRRGSKGQSMVLGAVAMLCLTLGVLATLNLGQAVHEKIKLQNNADAAAYSLATLEARVFNFIAFTNRVQISHYHTAMVVQSYLSYAGYSLAIYGTATDMLRGLFYANRDWCSRLSYPANIPFCIAAAIEGPVSIFADMLMMFAQVFYEVTHYFAKTFVEAMSLYNRDAVHRRVQLMKAAQLNVHILTGMEEFIRTNDQQLGWGAQNNLFNMVVNTALNSYEYWAAFDKSSGLNPAGFGLLFAARDLNNYKMDATDDGVKEAQSVMAEIANATRSHKDIYDRSGQALATTMFTSVTGQHKGQTRLIGGDGDTSPDPEIGAIRTQGHYGSCTGDRLASDDFVSSGSGFGVGGPVFAQTPTRRIGDGIRTDARGGEHYRYKHNSRYQGPRGMTVTPPPNGRASDPFETDQEHKWTGQPYLAPYFKFKISGDRTKEYGQPSTWFYLNKRPANFQTGQNQKPWHSNFSVGGVPRGNYVRSASGGTNNNLTFQGRGGSTVSLDTTIGGDRQAFMDMMKGLNVLSRGQVYYHRPGDWREQPNFFNPFWRSRLAPIAQVLTNLWDRLVSSNLVPGPEAGLLQRMVQNFVNNALADFFFRTVTGLITH